VFFEKVFKEYFLSIVASYIRAFSKQQGFEVVDLSVQLYLVHFLTMPHRPAVNLSLPHQEVCQFLLSSTMD